MAAWNSTRSRARSSAVCCDAPDAAAVEAPSESTLTGHHFAARSANRWAYCHSSLSQRNRGEEGEGRTRAGEAMEMERVARWKRLASSSVKPWSWSASKDESSVRQMYRHGRDAASPVSSLLRRGRGGTDFL